MAATDGIKVAAIAAAKRKQGNKKEQKSRLGFNLGAGLGFDLGQPKLVQPDPVNS